MSDELEDLEPDRFELDRFQEIEEELVSGMRQMAELGKELHSLFLEEGRSEADFMVAWGTTMGRMMVALTGGDPDE